ncbi:luciferase-type oxidoreductase, BA3436 family [Saccharopolyspora kobensis]|uniref:Luciferase-type oxidoreductase, BA3436 family n=1 Tax=Saccharopolyspora kobensis TaxID=146035 RepID=A0A1H6AJT1_9PSEU|nr:LLM class oxidoreductase [Saccharopolyspora kobensis]SEG48968.1 luciferase-type oxidoreductase, BA3436 family [Saccharopolyspora kobensis]SFE58708.1 luciferase-type oxidoreductase, BA3436 family [Saccharopolyspora kobensis]
MPETDLLAEHPGFRTMFAPGELTVGLFLPLWPYTGDMAGMAGQGEAIRQADEAGFAAIWVRDVPLFDPGFGDVGQVYDPWTYLAWLAAHTRKAALAAGSAIFSLRHPIDLAKQAASLDHLSGGRLVLGIASGDRPVEFPAYGVDFESRGARYREAVQMFRTLLESTKPTISSPLGQLRGSADLLPKPVTGRIPLLVTGSSRQTPEWIAEHSDGWLVYPGAANAAGATELGRRVAAWRELVPGGQFKPVATNEWIDLVEDPKHPPTPLRGGFVLQTGTEGLLDMLHRWQEAGINHGALGVQHGRRPAAEAVAQLAEEVVPHFPALAAPAPKDPVW